MSSTRHFKYFSRTVKSALFFSISTVYSVFAQEKRDRHIIACTPSYFGGNVKAIYDYMIKDQIFENCDIYWITHNMDELKKLRKNGMKAFLDRDVLRIPRFFKTGVWITDHGPGNIPLYLLSVWKVLSINKMKGNSVWIDTWHGTATLEKSSENRAKMLKYYDIGFVSSDFFKLFYSSVVS